MIDPDVAVNYLDFVGERHRIWEARQQGEATPWTKDPVLARKKFTNVFRILDPGTQFILTDLAADDPSPRDFLLRCFLYRHTGRIEAWQYLAAELGEYPTEYNLNATLAVWQRYRGVGVTKLKPPRRPGQTGPGNGHSATKFDRPIFTGAYLVFPQSAERGTDKLGSILKLTERLFSSGSPDDVMPDFLAARTQAERFATLRRNKGVADFMSMQTLTDWGYGPHAYFDHENEFIVLGPGATRGAKALDPAAPVQATFEWAWESVLEMDDCPQLSLDGYGENYRAPSYMDVQNTLCEFSKLVRFQSKPVTGKPYSPAHPGPQDPPVLPQHW